jgi:hypothetical protein
VKVEYVTESRALLNSIRAQHASQKGGAANVGALTQEQNANLKALLDQMSRARDTAKRAFKGQDVKLREEFQVGINKPNDLASHLQRARVILAACQKADNAAALAAKGWIAADTQALSDAIGALDTADDSQESAKATKTGLTGQRNIAANDLYERLLTIQNAANLQWPASGGNIAVRAEFRIGLFPPKANNKRKPVAADKPVAPQPPAQ